MIARKSLIEILTFDIHLSYYINQIALNSVVQIVLFELVYKIQKSFCFKFERKLVYLIIKVMTRKKKRGVTFITPER